MRNINRNEVNNSQPFFYLYFAQRLLNYYPNYSTRRLYFGEIETPYCKRVLRVLKAISVKLIAYVICSTGLDTSATTLLLLSTCQTLFIVMCFQTKTIKSFIVWHMSSDSFYCIVRYHRTIDQDRKILVECHEKDMKDDMKKSHL